MSSPNIHLVSDVSIDPGRSSSAAVTTYSTSPVRTGVIESVKIVPILGDFSQCRPAFLEHLKESLWGRSILGELQIKTYDSNRFCPIGLSLSKVDLEGLGCVCPSRQPSEYMKGAIVKQTASTMFVFNNFDGCLASIVEFEVRRWLSDRNVNREP